MLKGRPGLSPAARVPLQRCGPVGVQCKVKVACTCWVMWDDKRVVRAMAVVALIRICGPVRVQCKVQVAGCVHMLGDVG